MSEQICLKWNSFLNNIATSFESLWEDEGLVDVTLTSDGQCLTAHKLILSSSSPFFKKVFQTNRSQHPVIVFQDIHFSELQALLIFIYKGEVNIDQKKLPALLKAAETLQIRGLSGGDILNRDCYTRLDELEQSASEGTGQSQFAAEPRRKKKQKVSDFQGHGNQILDKILIPRITRSLSRASESSSSDKGVKDGDVSNDTVNSGYRRLEMKLEPVEVMTEDLQKFPHANNEKDKLETGHSDGDQGETRDNSTEDISGLSGLTGLGDDKPILYAYQQLPHAELLPNPDVITSWASSRPIDHLACDLMKILFTTEERILCNVNGKMGKQQFDSSKIHLIREVLLHYSTITPNSVEWEEAWKNCVTKIDTSNRGLKRYLFQRRSVYSQ